MSRILILNRNSLTALSCDRAVLWSINHCFQWLSPVKGRLYTRYAPCAGRQRKQASLLPLDLHVLGLPLAFILSQDQTLHCKVFRSISRKK